MAMEQRLELKLLQKLILTPQLQQAIKMLQLPQLELSQTITQELIENPFLEEVPEEPEEPDMSQALQDPLPLSSEVESPLHDMTKFAVDDYFEERGQDGRDLGYFTDGTVPPPSFDLFASKGSDLQEHLGWQLRLTNIPEDLSKAVQTAIGNVDEDGYLRLGVKVDEITLEEIAQLSGCSAQVAGQAIGLLQSFDPLGIGATDLKECLTIQLRAMGLEAELPWALITNNLDDLPKKKYRQLAADYGTSVEEVLEAVKVIESLEPKPGRNFSNSSPVYIEPDVYVVKDNDSYRIILNDEHMPSLRINGYYRKLLMQKKNMPKDEKQYLEKKFDSARWFLKSLDHRNKTIYRVTETILEFQRDFFDNGVSGLKPMNLRDVAENLQMHESTISRATSNKYLSCGHGLLVFRYFFSSGIPSASGSLSSTSVKDMIRKLIAQEDRLKPLSDQKVAELLMSKNIKLARRTVAKYREEMKIPPQIQRRKYN